MLQIIPLETDEHRRHVTDLFKEYLSWVNSMVSYEFDISFDVNTVLEQDLNKLQRFAPPLGRPLPGQYEAKIVGCACLRKIGENVGELKRMHV